MKTRTYKFIVKKWPPFDEDTDPPPPGDEPDQVIDAIAKAKAARSNAKDLFRRFKRLKPEEFKTYLEEHPLDSFTLGSLVAVVAEMADLDGPRRGGINKDEKHFAK